MFIKFFALSCILYPFFIAFYMVLEIVITMIIQSRQRAKERRIIKANFKRFMENYRYEKEFTEKLKEL